MPVYNNKFDKVFHENYKRVDELHKYTDNKLTELERRGLKSKEEWEYCVRFILDCKERINEFKQVQDVLHDRKKCGITVQESQFKTIERLINQKENHIKRLRDITGKYVEKVKKRSNLVN